MDAVEPFLHNDVVPEGCQYLVLSEGRALVQLARLEEAAHVELFDGLELLLERQVVIRRAEHDVTTSHESDSFGLQIVVLLDPIHDPVVASTLCLDHSVVVLRAESCQAVQKFMQGTPHIIGGVFIDAQGWICFHNGNTIGWICRKTCPILPRAWKERSPLFELAREGPVVHVPGDKLIPGDWACKLDGAAACRGIHGVGGKVWLVGGN